MTLGSQKFQFNRVLKELDRLIDIGEISENVFAQIGYSDYSPKYYKYKEFLNSDDFYSAMQESNIVITHGGTGAIINSVKMGKKVVAIPRLKIYNEHVDNHQIEIVKKFEDLGFIKGCYDSAEILDSIDYVKTHDFKSYVSNTETIIDDIKEFIQINYK